MKQHLGLIFGGQSAEHEVSLQSGKSIFEAVDKNRFIVSLIGISKKGNWYLLDPKDYLYHPEDPGHIALKFFKEQQIALIPYENGHKILYLNDGKMVDSLDIAFNIVHGTHGEDGGLQGYFNVLNLPYVGADVLGASVGMDKHTAKMLLIQAGVPVANSLTIFKSDFRKEQLEDLVAPLGWPLFVKPSNSGSSIGVQKAKTSLELRAAVKFAFRFDNRVLVETFIKGREIECSVLGNDQILVSLPGEIVPQHEFYSYEAKYIDKDGAQLIIPAPLSGAQISEIQNLAIKTFKALSCSGFARIDFFLTEDGQFILNEINTLPGFTNISMYPKLWAVSGLQYTHLITRLIELAYERHKEKLDRQQNILKARES